MRYKLTILIGPISLLIFQLLPNNLFEVKAKLAIGLIVWMAYWWIIRPVNIAVTAMLPIAVNAFFDIIPMSQIINQYSSEIIFLLLGANIITITWTKTGFDNRLALKTLCLIGPSLKQQIFVWCLLSALLSLFLPNIVICSILIPIAVSMLKYIDEEDFEKSEAAALILLAITWGTGAGGCGTPLGGAMNLVAIEYIEQYIGTEFMYIQWLYRMMPFWLIMISIVLFYLLSFKTKKKILNGSKQYFHKLYNNLEIMRKNEIISLIILLFAILLVFLRPLYESYFPGIKPAYIFIIFAIIAFLFNDAKMGKLIDWKDVEKNIMWEMLFLVAGGLAAGKLFTDSGAAYSLAVFISGIPNNSGIFTIAIFVFFTWILAEITSNTAAAAISLPIVLSVTQTLNLNPIPYIYITTVAFNNAYMLPLAIRAIPVGYGMSPSVLIKKGYKIAIISILVITTVGYLFINFWPMFNNYN